MSWKLGVNLKESAMDDTQKQPEVDSYQVEAEGQDGDLGNLNIDEII